MSHRLKIIKEHVDVFITAPNQTFKQHFIVDKHASKIIGIAFSSDNDILPYYRGSQKISINEKEVYPENYQSKMIMHGLNVEVNKRRVDFDGEELEPGNRKVEIEYKDADHPFVPFTPYQIILYVYSRIDD